MWCRSYEAVREGLTDISYGGGVLALFGDRLQFGSTAPANTSTNAVLMLDLASQESMSYDTLEHGTRRICFLHAA